MMSERLPFLDDEPKITSNSISKYETKRLIELLEAIDWKLWMLYSMVSNGEIKVELNKKDTDLDKNPFSDDKSTNE